MITRWFSIWWWKYLLEKKNNEVGWIRTIICRARNHPCGVWWYNPNGFEPDMHCKNCNDDLG